VLYRVVHGLADLGGLPEPIRPLVQRCLAKNPASRPGTSEILATLASLADTVPARSATPPAGNQPEFSVPTLTAMKPPTTPSPAIPPPPAPSSAAAPPPVPDPGTAQPVSAAPRWIPSPGPGPGPGPAGATPMPADLPPYRSKPGRPPSRRRWLVPVLAVAVAAAVAGGVLAWAPWQVHPPGRPAGLAAGAATANSLSFSWFQDPQGAAPDRYVIWENGSQIGSVPGSVTQYQALGLAPDSAYQFQVSAIHGALRSARSRVLTLRTLVPPLSAATVSGTWTVRYTVSKAAKNDAYFGSKTTHWTDSWEFTPLCAAGPCAVTLAGQIQDSAFTVQLTPSGDTYRGSTTTTSLEYCVTQKDMVRNTITVQLTLSAARTLLSSWAATSWTGTFTMTDAYISVGKQYCSAGTSQAAIAGGRD
jgi:hypothetical protein